MKIIVFFILSFFMIETVNSQIKIDNIWVYKHFDNAGTTASLNACFRKSIKQNIDTLKIKVIDKDVVLFEELINNAKSRHHFQMKMEVMLALIAEIDSLEHYFVVVNPKLIVDLVSRKNYRLKDYTSQNKLLEFVEKYKK